MPTALAWAMILFAFIFLTEKELKATRDIPHGKTLTLERPIVSIKLL